LIVSADSPFAPYVVGSVVDHAEAVSGLRIAWVKTRLSVHATG
jgi:hypothetical protein